MDNFDQIYKQLTYGVKRSLQNKNNASDVEKSTLCFRVLPNTDEPTPKRPNVVDDGEVEKTDIQILAGTKLAFTGVNRKAQAAKKKQTAESLQRMHAERMQHIRKLNRIYTWGDDIPDPFINFTDLQLSDAIIDNLVETKIAEPSPIQMQSIPVMLAKRNLLASAPTGSGKTLAFALPLIQTCVKLWENSVAEKRQFQWPVAIVLEPTRVLAKQAHQHIERFAQNLPIKCGFLEEEFDRTNQIIVSTPNKMIFALEAMNEKCRRRALNRLRWLVVDESDRIFDTTEGELSFRPQLEKIMSFCAGEKTRRAFFSATFSYDVEEWCGKNLEQPVMVCIGSRNSANASVEQRLVFVGWEQAKVYALKTLIQTEFTPPVLVFVQSKERAKQLLVELSVHFKKFPIALISSEITNKKCDEIIAAFRAGTIQLLICTELMGRGLDFENVNLVVNFDLPTSIISYIHRVGRTGRAGRKGKAVTYFTKDDMDIVRPIATVIHQAGFPVADYLLRLKKVSKNKRKKLQKRAPKRKGIVREHKWKSQLPRYVKIGKGQRDFFKCRRKSRQTNRKEPEANDVEQRKSRKRPSNAKH